MEIKGIDVSSWQGKPDWAKVAQSGIKFALLRIHQQTGIDSSFEHNYKGCKSNGVLVGGYKYSYAKTTTQAEQEADAVLAVLGGRGMDFPVFYDLEWPEQRELGSAAIERIALAFLRKVKAAGYKVGIYCNVDWYNNVLTPELKEYDCWLASYPANDTGTIVERLRPSQGVGWQYSSKGKVPGIEGNVDMDVFYTDYREDRTEPHFTGQDAISRVLSVAKGEVGYLEKRSCASLDDKTENAGSGNYTKYWRDIKPDYQGQPWCAAFISWVFMTALGLETAKNMLKHWPYVYCPTLGDLFTRYANPHVGDIVIFYRNGEFAHTGIVTKVQGDKFWTVEGNTSGASGIIANGGGVCEKSYYNSDLPGTKFCRPDYSLAVSADLGSQVAKGDDYMFKVDTVQKGSVGNHVLLVQEILRARGFKGADGAELALDRECGENTVHAIKDYQRVREAVLKDSCGGVDGVAGEKTLRDMIAL